MNGNADKQAASDSLLTEEIFGYQTKNTALTEYHPVVATCPKCHSPRITQKRWAEKPCENCYKKTPGIQRLKLLKKTQPPQTKQNRCGICGVMIPTGERLCTRHKMESPRNRMIEEFKRSRGMT